MTTAPAAHSMRALLLAPSEHDATIISLLRDIGIKPSPCADATAMVQELEKGAGLAILTDGGVRGANLSQLSAWVAAQPPWSDFPFVLITDEGVGIERNPTAARVTLILENVNIVERPFHAATLTSAIRVALRTRRQQYEARDRLEELREGARRLEQMQAALAQANESLTTAVAERTRELAASEARFRTIFNSAVQFTGMIDLNGVLLTANQTSLDAVNITLADVIGKPLWETAWVARTPEEAERIRREIPRAAAGELVHYELNLLLADDARHTFDFSMKPVRDGAGPITQIVVEGRDVTELKQTQAALMQAQKMDTLGQITGGVAHDFNNLLMAVMANLDLMKKFTAGQPKLERLLDGALQGAKRGATLTQRLLSFARKQDLKAEAVDLTALIDGAKDLLARSVGPLVALKLENNAKLPPAKVDPHQLELALMNLAVNARDAMPKGGTITIRVEGVTSAHDRPIELDPGSYIRLSVGDNGVGMDAATLERAIEPFFSTKELGKGTGLGLSMVHGLAVQSGGALRLKSKKGEGTNVEIWLPVAVENAAAMLEEPRAADRRVKPVTILVVDDDALIAMSTADMLQDLGHEVFEALSGPKALEILRTRTVQLMITDYAMPGMTGLQLVRAARELYPDLHVLLASGYADLPEGAMTDLPRLPKPYIQEQLASQVAKLLGH